MLRLKLHWQILIGLVLSIPAGLVVKEFGQDGYVLGFPLLQTYEFLGELFMSALKMIIVPLIASAIISGMYNAGAIGGFGRLGLKTIAYYLITGLLAVFVGLVLVNLIQPGLIDGQPARDALGLSGDISEIRDDVTGKGASDIAGILLRLIPTNVIAAAADNGQMLGLIFFSLLFGYFMTRIHDRYSDSLGTFWQGVYEVMMRMTHMVMRFAPLGVLVLVAQQVATTGAEVFEHMLPLFFTVLLALLVHLLITFPLILRFVAGVSPIRHFRAAAPALGTAFSTSSSSATLPVTIDCVEANAGVSNRTASFVLPLGATVNMNGTALYECVAAMFIAQAYGLDLSFGVQFTIVATALLTSIGVAGIPSASLVAIAVILNAVGLPLESLGLILAIDRPLDMCRTAINVFGDTVGAVVIGRSEGEEGILQDARPGAAPSSATAG